MLLTANGAPKVTDFGLAKRLDAGPGLTQSGVIVGTARQVLSSAPSTATYLLSIHGYVRGFTEGDMGSAAAIAWVVVVLVNILAIVFLRLLARGEA